MAKFSLFGTANNTDPITLVGLQNGANIKTTDASLRAYLKTIGLATRIIVTLCNQPQSTQYDSTNKRACGDIYFDPTNTNWSLSATSVATFYMLIETTNADNAARGELFQKSGAGSPQVIAATPTTTGTTATLVSVDVSAAFVPTAAAGIFVARTWITTNNSTDYATCSGAWIEIQP